MLSSPPPSPHSAPPPCPPTPRSTPLCSATSCSPSCPRSPAHASTAPRRARAQVSRRVAPDAATTLTPRSSRASRALHPLAGHVAEARLPLAAAAARHQDTRHLARARRCEREARGAQRKGRLERACRVPRGQGRKGRRDTPRRAVARRTLRGGRGCVKGARGVCQRR